MPMVGGSLVSQTSKARRRMSRTTVCALLATFVEQSHLGRCFFVSRDFSTLALSIRLTGHYLSLIAQDTKRNFTFQAT